MQSSHAPVSYCLVYFLCDFTSGKCGWFFVLFLRPNIEAWLGAEDSSDEGSTSDDSWRQVECVSVSWELVSVSLPAFFFLLLALYMYCITTVEN